ncbi:SemiSWEET family sugar transporter [Vibrio mediterranei]
MSSTEVIGLISAAMTTLSFIPQFVRIMQTGDVKAISTPMFLMQTLGVGGWFYYGVATNAAPVYIANGIVFPLVLAILIMKIKYDKSGSRH